MVYITKEAINYTVGLSTGLGLDPSTILLRCKDQYSLYIHFLEESQQNKYDDANKEGTAYVALSEYPHYIDLMRKEKPIFVIFSDTPSPNFSIYASDERLGEEEELLERITSMDKKVKLIEKKINEIP